jgi:hypothetical protein
LSWLTCLRKLAAKGSDAGTQAQLADLADELDPNIRRQSEIAAEDKVVEALVAEGFPQDRIERIGHLKLGFDIRAHKIADEATGEVFVKRVEVKGRLRGQPVRLTTNEWYKAQQLAETYWLYVVWDPLGDSPELGAHPQSRCQARPRQTGDRGGEIL